MKNRRSIVVAGAALLALTAIGTGCSDDSTSGPMFGDLTFSPSFENIHSERSVELTLRNSGSADLGPVLVGLDGLIKRSFAPDSICNSMSASVAPSSFSALASGEEGVVQVTIDTNDVDLQACPVGSYDADVFAAAGGSILGGATIRFDWDGP